MPKTLVYTATKVQGVVLSGTPANALLAWIESVPAGARIEVQYKVLAKNHSDNQRRRYFARHVYGVMELLNSDKRRAHLAKLNKDQVHEALKKGCNGFTEAVISGVIVRTGNSTKPLDIEQFSNYCRKIDEWVFEEYHVVLPEYGDDY